MDWARKVNPVIGFPVANDLRKLHFREFRFRRNLCGFCAGVKNTFIFLRKSGAHSRT